MQIYHQDADEMAMIKVWLPQQENLPADLLRQAEGVARLPFVFKWLALMPDCHYGYGMPIGGVLAAKDVIVPNAVGMDIGCGMSYIQTDVLYEEIKDVRHNRQSLLQLIVNQVMREIPVGGRIHKSKQTSQVIEEVLLKGSGTERLPKQQKILTNALYQIGTLGGGNHFIEFQVDQEGFIGIMLHSGSRNLGAEVCRHFNQVAKELNERWYSQVPENNQLPFLPIKSQAGQGYLTWMKIALAFAAENREVMLRKTMNIFSEMIEKQMSQTVTYDLKINCQHNYAALEKHYGEDVWVHRKGATRAQAGDLGIIPGAMGSVSYLVSGLGNPESFHSSAHGAGRVYSRRQAKAEISMEEVILDLQTQDVILGKVKKKDVAEESRFAYKDLEAVMANQKDLVIPLKKLRTVAVIKG